MPAVSKNQFKFIHVKRKEYGSEDDTPDKWKWIWKSEWTDVSYKDLPKKVKRENIMASSSADEVKTKFLAEVFGG